MQIVPQSIHDQDRASKEEEFDAEVQWVATLAPDFFVANKKKYLAEKLSFRGKTLSDFNEPAPPQQPAPQGAPQGAPQEGAPQPGGQPALGPLAEGAQAPGASPLEQGAKLLG